MQLHSNYKILILILIDSVFVKGEKSESQNEIQAERKQ